jgi:hypothetical protein
VNSDQSFSGQIVDISSGGVYFSCAEVLALGAKVQLAIDWPALLLKETRLRLDVVGRVVRRDEHGTAIAILQYEFRTRKAASGESATPETIRVA